MNSAEVFRGASFTTSGMSAYRNWFAAPALIAFVAFAGCGGGGSSAGPGTAPAAAGTFTANFTFTIPAAPAALARRPAYISASSSSLVINIVYPGATVPGLVLNVNPLPAACSVTDGVTMCNVVVVAQASAKSFIVTFFDAPNGQGNALSTSTVAVPPAPNGVATINLTLDGVVARVGLSLVGLAYGRPGSAPLVVTAYDADGNVIGGSTPYSAPIQLSTSSAALALSTTTVTSPASTVNVTYNGVLDPTLLVIAQPQGKPPIDLQPFGPTPTPYASPSPSPTPTPAPLVALPPLAPSLTLTGPATVSVSEMGYRGQYTVMSSNTQVVTVTTPVTSIADVTAIAIDALNSGTANVTVTDSNGQSVVFPVTVTLTPITIQGVRHGSQR